MSIRSNFMTSAFDETVYEVGNSSFGETVVAAGASNFAQIVVAASALTNETVLLSRCD